MKQTTTTDTILRNKIEEILQEICGCEGFDFTRAEANREHKRIQNKLLALFESAIQKTREETLKPIKQLVALYFIDDKNRREIMIKLAASLKEKQIKV